MEAAPTAAAYRCSGRLFLTIMSSIRQNNLSWAQTSSSMQLHAGRLSKTDTPITGAEFTCITVPFTRDLRPFPLLDCLPATPIAEVGDEGATQRMIDAA
jgi:hypothetical protein